MNADVTAVTPATSLVEAAAVLRSSQASDLMVVDRDNVFVASCPKETSCVRQCPASRT